MTSQSADGMAIPQDDQKDRKDWIAGSLAVLAALIAIASLILAYLSFHREGQFSP